MHISTPRKGSELSIVEKADIFSRMSLAQTSGEKDLTRKSLAEQYGIKKGSIGSLIAHETMRKQKGSESEGNRGNQGILPISSTEVTSGVAEKSMNLPGTDELRSQTQDRVYMITTLVDLTEVQRKDIISEFSYSIQNSAGNASYDFYQDIEVISDNYDIEPTVLEQFLRNTYKWLSDRLDVLRAGRDLTEEDKLYIRMYIQDGISIKEKKKRRKEMAKQYTVSIYVISSLSAWKLGENGDKILKKDEEQIVDSIVSEINPQTTLVAHDNQIDHISVISTGDEVEDSDNDVGEVNFSEEFTRYIQELAPEYDLQDNEQRGAFLQHIFDIFTNATIDDVKKIILDFPDDTKHENIKRSGEGMGAIVNYNNEIKNKWRQKLKEFIDENTDKEKRATMKVLCLPGMECLEIPLYLELGFKPENIIGVEAGIVKGKKDPEVIARFQSKAAEYGIQTRIGKLEKVLETEDTVFDVVSLDFLGPINNQTLDIIHSIKSSKRHIFLTNFQAKRENLLQNQLIGMAGFQKNGRYVLMGEDRYKGVYGETEEIRSKSNAILDDYRNSSVIAQILRSYRVFFQNRSEGKLNDRLNAIFSTQNIIQIGEFTSDIGVIPTRPGLARMLVDSISRIFDNIFDTYEGYLPGRNISILKTQIHVFIRDILLENNTYVPIHKMYSYSSTGTPMITDLIVFDESLPEDIYDFKELYNVILNLADVLIKDTIKHKLDINHTSLGYHIKDKNFSLKEGPGNKTDQLVITKDNSSIVMIPFGRLLKILGMFAKYKISKNQYSTERISIE